PRRLPYSCWRGGWRPLRVRCPPCASRGRPGVCPTRWSSPAAPPPPFSKPEDSPGFLLTPHPPPSFSLLSPLPPSFPSSFRLFGRASFPSYNTQEPYGHTKQNPTREAGRVIGAESQGCVYALRHRIRALA